MLDIFYFASFREALGQSQEQLPLASYKTVACLLDDLSKRGDAWQLALSANPNLQIAVNQTIADRSTRLTAGDEIALFPPVTGG